MKNQTLFFVIVLIFGSLLMLSCDKEEFTGVGTDLIQAKQELSNNNEASSTAPIVVDEVLAPKNESARGGLPTKSTVRQLELLYSNSFETKEDLTSVFEADFKEGILTSIDTESHLLSDNTPRSGGNQSLVINAPGCVGSDDIIIKVGPFEEDQNVLVKFWGQNVNGAYISASVQLNVTDDVSVFDPFDYYQRDLEVSTNEEEWQIYQTDEILPIPAEKVLQVKPIAHGGIAGGTTVYFDLLEVYNVVE